MPKHHNSFDFLRLVFAVMVIITHSLVLSGAGEGDFLFRFTGGQIDCSYLGVRGFFLISGFLIFKSLQRSTGVLDYLTKRALRIFPALIVMLLLVTLVAGPLLSSFPVGAYFRNGETWNYLGSSLRIPGFQKSISLPGVFSHNPGTNAVNGSLWTVWFELLFYVGLLAAFFPFRNKISFLKWALPISWALLYIFFVAGHHFLDAHIFPFTGMSAEIAVDLGLFFLAGSALTLVPWQRASLRRMLLIAGLLIVIIGLSFHVFYYLRYLGLPVLIMAAGHYYIPVFSQIRRLGEPSYGIYIYAFPLQQAIIQVLSPSPMVVTLLAIPLSMLLGYASWHLVESPFLGLKNK